MVTQWKLRRTNCLMEEWTRRGKGKSGSREMDKAFQRFISYSSVLDKRGRFAATVCRYLRGGVCYRKKKCYRRRVGRSTEYCCRVGPRVCRAKYMKACVLCWRCRNRHYRPRLICRRRKVCRKYICHYLPYCICPCHYRGWLEPLLQGKAKPDQIWNELTIFDAIQVKNCSFSISQFVA